MQSRFGPLFARLYVTIILLLNQCSHAHIQHDEPITNFPAINLIDFDNEENENGVHLSVNKGLICPLLSMCNINDADASGIDPPSDRYQPFAVLRCSSPLHTPCTVSNES